MNKMMDDSTTLLVKYLKSAAKQRYLLDPWLSDKQFVADGGTLFHAVDTDVIKLYAAPSEMSIATLRRKEGYAQVFPDDEKPVSIALGRTLADFIFYRLNKDGAPLLVIPPLEQEVQEVFSAVKHNSEVEQKNALVELEKLRGIIDRLKNLEMPDQIVAEMQKQAPALARFFAGTSGPSAEHRRFLTLLAKKRIMPLNYAAESGHFHDESIRKIMGTPDIAGQVAMHDLREAWLNRLLTKKSGGIEFVNVYDDAQVLARLEWINAKLSDKERLVLITGDNAIYEAAGDYSPFRDDPTNKESTKSFAELYLRHPKSYLAEPWVLSPEDANNQDTDHAIETEFFKWLETFLGNLHLEGDSYPDALRKLMKKRDEEIRDLLTNKQGDLDKIMSDFKLRWQRYARSAMLAHGPTSGDEYRKNSSALELWENLSTSFDKAEALLDRLVLETWGDFFDLVTATGYDLVFIRQTEEHKTELSKSRMRPRNPPLLDFDSLTKAKAFILKILASYDSGKIKNYQEEIEKLREENSSGYTYYLAFAVLFATEGIWNVAAILSERAKEIAQKNSDPHITGREACYLLAVSLRHAAEKMEDLEKISPLLDEAEACLRKDKEYRPNLKIGFDRFEAERLALALTYHLFHRFRETAKPLPNDVMTLEELESSAKHMLDNLAKETKPEIRFSVERNLLTNLFMSTFLRLGPQIDKDDKCRDSLGNYFERFKMNLLTTETELKETFLVHSVFQVADWWMARDKQKKKAIQRDIHKFLSEQQIKANKVMPYDRSRFVLLRNIATLN